MLINYNGKTFSLSEEQIEAAYRYQLHQWRLADAKRHYLEFAYGCDPEREGTEKEHQEAERDFYKKYGFPVSEGLTMLEDFVQKFEDDFDCNMDESAMWKCAICVVIAMRESLLLGALL